MDKEKILDLTESMKHGMFATKDSPKEGLDYAYSLIETLPKEHRIAAFTALHVSLNSIASEFNKLIV